MLPPAVQRQVDKAAELSKSVGGDALPNTDASAGILEKARSDLAVSQAEVTRLVQSMRVLQGKYEAEVPRMAEEIRVLKGERQELQTQLERANIKPGQINSLSEDERSMAGDMVNVSAKIAREVAGEAIDTATKPLRDELATMRRQSEDTFRATLDSGLPAGWDSATGVNEDPKFLAWLNGVDPATSRARFDLLKRAEAAKQGHQVVEIFRAFMENREVGARVEASSGPRKEPAQDPGPGGGGGSIDLSADGGKKMWTRAQISHFYTNKRTDPQYQGPDGMAKARAIEVDIAAAQREGRVSG